MLYKILFLLIGSYSIFAGDFATVQVLKLSKEEIEAFNMWNNNSSLDPNLNLLIKVYQAKKFEDEYQDDLLILIKERLKKMPAVDKSINDVKKLFKDAPELKIWKRRIEQGWSENFLLQIGKIVLLSIDGRHLTLRTLEDKIFNYSFHSNKNRWLWQEVLDPKFRLIPTPKGKPELVLNGTVRISPRLLRTKRLDYLLRERQVIQ